jgi:pseudouridine-5'-phosphate glycosidase
VERVRRAGVTGQAVTPAVLAAVEELSDGRSVEVNRRLIADNAELAARVAVAYAGLSPQSTMAATGPPPSGP